MEILREKTRIYEQQQQQQQQQSGDKVNSDSTSKEEDTFKMFKNMMVYIIEKTFLNIFHDFNINLILFFLLLFLCH